MKFHILLLILYAVFFAAVSSQSLLNEPEVKSIAVMDNLNIGEEVFVLIDGKQEKLKMTSP